MSIPFRSFRRSSLLVLAVAGLAARASASEVDSWGGQIWLRHETDVFAFPHRALEFRNSATVVFVPPTTSPSDFRAVDPYQEVAGVLMFGQERWQGIIGANVPNYFSPLEAHGSGTHRGWGRQLVHGDINEYHLVHGIDTFPEGSALPTGQMHLGAALQATDALGVGATIQTFGDRWSEELVSGTGPAATRGFDISGWTFSGSGGLEVGGALENLEAAVAYGSSDREQFDAGTFAGGTGNASTFSIAGLGTFANQDWITSKWDLDYDAYLRFDKTSSDFTDRQDPVITTAAPKVEDDYTAVDGKVGVSYQNGGFQLGTSIGIRDYTDEEKTSSPAVRSEWKYEVTQFPSCDFAGDIPVWKGLGFQYGMRAFWESNTTTVTDFDPATGTQTSKSEAKDESVGTSYHAGLLWDITEDWRVTATLDTDQLGDPGGAVFGNNTDAPFIAIGARVNF